MTSQLLQWALDRLSTQEQRYLRRLKESQRREALYREYPDVFPQYRKGGV